MSQRVFAAMLVSLLLLCPPSLLAAPGLGHDQPMPKNRRAPTMAPGSVQESEPAPPGDTNDATDPAAPAQRPRQDIDEQWGSHRAERPAQPAPTRTARQEPEKSSARPVPAQGPTHGAIETSHPAAPKKKTSAFAAFHRVVKWMHILPSTTWYVGYEYRQQGEDSSNQFRITRGYVTLKFKPTPWFQPRITLDTHQDDSGDWKVRLKYLHAKFILPWETRVVTNPSVEVGLVHNPWFDYEEHIDRYRAEGPMFIERNGLLNSADVGLTFGVLLGRKLDAEYQKSVNAKYPGEFGSIQFGIYNGAGYHAKEFNQNKVFMTRESIRPLGSFFPNVQITHFFVFGRGNTPSQVCDDQNNCIPGQPRWILNLFMASMEHEYFTVTAQYVMGKGNQKGDEVDADGSPLSFQGYSVFGEVKLPWIHTTVMGRFDWFDWKTLGRTSRLLAGVAYHFLPHNFLLLSLDRASFTEPGQDTDWRVKATVQVHL